MAKRGNAEDPTDEPEPRRPKPVIWLTDRFKMPPMAEASRAEAGFLLRRIQFGESVGMPASRPMPAIGPRCHELRIRDETQYWRVVYRVDVDAILVVSTFPKKNRATPKAEIDLAKKRLADYDAAKG